MPRDERPGGSVRYLILGSGPAGLGAALAILDRESDAEVVVASEEYAAPYLRPLLPDVVSGEADFPAIADPLAPELAGRGVKIREGKRVRRVDPARNRVEFTDGTEESFNFLLIATGGKSVVPPALAKSPGHVFPVDTLGDALRIREGAKGKGGVVVYGPGYPGIETCRALRKAGRDVTWLRPGLPRFGNPVSAEMEAAMLDGLRKAGVTIREGVDVADVLDFDGSSCVVWTHAGEEIRCGMIVVVTERAPCVGFLEGSGIAVGAGVIVDEYLRTNVSNIYAAGDCAEVRDRETRRTRINFGWRSAIKQGRLAGGNMVGGGNLYIRNRDDYFWLLFGAPVADPER
jgi:NADPH-dependent 2,4-dienoyl-CoA reductase/sulfur reductase-like enzyme